MYTLASGACRGQETCRRIFMVAINHPPYPIAMSRPVSSCALLRGPVAAIHKI